MRLLFALAAVPLACAHTAAKKEVRPPDARAVVIAADARVIDKVVAVVLNRPITLSECELEVRLDRAVAGDIAGASGPVSPSDEARVLPELVDRAAIIRAFKRSYPANLDPQVARGALKKLRGKFPDDDSWHRFLDRVELSDDEVEERLRRALEAQQILIARLSDTVRVSRKEIEDYITAHPGAGVDQAKMALGKDAAQQELPGVLAEARRTSGARIIDPIVAPPEEPGSAIGTSDPSSAAPVLH